MSTLSRAIESFLTHPDRPGIVIIEQWEAGTEQPAAGQLDAVVWTYASLTGHPEAELWGQALLRAATHPRVMGAPPGGIAIVATDDGKVDFYT